MHWGGTWVPAMSSRFSTPPTAASTPCSGCGWPNPPASCTTSTFSTTLKHRWFASCAGSWCAAWSDGRPAASLSSWGAGRPGAGSDSVRSPSWSACSPIDTVRPGGATATSSMRSETVRRIIRAYDDPVVRAYSWVRFGILRQRFLDEIGQYLPETGPVLDIGCGFGLFSLYYAATGPRRLLRGLDVNGRRIALARRAARRLGLPNVIYEEGDARDFKGDGEVQAAYMLDIVHHIAPDSVPQLLIQL